MYRQEALSNGLRIVTHPIKDRESVAVGIWIGVGGRYEENSVKGAAHFLEHIVFKGSNAYSCGQIKENIEGIGGSLNAFTSEEQTCFYAKIPTKHLVQTFDVLADMVIHPKIGKRDVEKERTVIVEEIKMYRDLPQYFVLELFDTLMWPGHPLGKNLAGTPQSVVATTNRDLKKFHQHYYTPDNVVISMCGNLDHDKVVRMVKRKLGSMKKENSKGYLPASPIQEGPRVKFYKKDIEQMHLVLGTPGVDENHPDRHALSLLGIILGGNMSSRLFVEVREKRGLAYSIASCAKTLHDTGQFVIRAGVDNLKVIQALGLIFKELKKIKTTSISSGEFTRAKDYLLGQFLMGLEDTMEHMLWIGDSLITKNELKTLKQVVKIYDKITRQDIKRVAQQILDENRFHLAIVGPVTTEQENHLKVMMNLA